MLKPELAEPDVGIWYFSLLAAYSEALAALRPAALQDEPTVLCAHPNQETVRLRPASVVRLKCTYALRHR